MCIKFWLLLLLFKLNVAALFSPCVSGCHIKLNWYCLSCCCRFTIYYCSVVCWCVCADVVIWRLYPVLLSGWWDLVVCLMSPTIHYLCHNLSFYLLSLPSWLVNLGWIGLSRVSAATLGYRRKRWKKCSDRLVWYNQQFNTWLKSVLHS